VQPTRRLGGDASGGEVGLQSLQQRLRAAAGLGERLKQGVHQVEQGCLIAAQHAVQEQVSGLQRVVKVQPSGQQ